MPATKRKPGTTRSEPGPVKLYRMHWTEGRGSDRRYVEMVVCPAHSETVALRRPDAYGTLHIGPGRCAYC